MKHIAILLAFLMMIGSQVSAGIVADRDSWNKMDLTLRFGYVMGVWDTMTLYLVGEPARASAYKDKLLACGNQMEMALFVSYHYSLGLHFHMDIYQLYEL